jgi:cysteine desulfurase
MEKRRVYFDNAATSPLDKEVIEAMLPIMQEYYGNPSSIHSDGSKVRVAIENARKKVAALLHVSPGEIFFTSGGTEADNMAIRCSVEDAGIKHAITSPIEHHAVLHTLEELAQKGKIKLSLVNLTANGHINFNHLEELLKNNEHSLVSLMHANNEVGNLLDMSKVGELCEKYHALFHSDTVQTVAHYPLDLKKSKVHFITCAAHKFNGPKGVGFVYISSDVKIHPFITGGTQERNMRGGTENVYGIVGLAKAMEVAYRDLEKDQTKILELKNYMAQELIKSIPGIKFNGDCLGNALYTILNASFPPASFNEMLLFKLDIAGVSCSGGSACSSGSNIGSHVLGALGVEQGRANVRFSFGKQNTMAEVDYVVAKLKELYTTPQPATTLP